MLILICFIFASSIILCSASWYIRRPSEPRSDGAEYVIDDTSAYFTTSESYDGKKHQPQITLDGVKVLYKDYADAETDESYQALYEDILENPSEYYTVTLLSSTYRDWDGSQTPITNTDHQEKYAGTYRYYITDETTGQVIAQNHAFQITPAKLEPTHTVDKTAVFIDSENGETLLGYTATWTGVNGEVYTIESNKSVTEADYTEHNSTIGFKTSFNATLSDSVSKPVKNNYDNYAAINIPYVILPQATIGSNYYGTLAQALGKIKTDTNPSGTITSGTITALQNVPYGENTYYSGTDFKHTLKDKSITIPSGVTLRVPNGIEPDDSIPVKVGSTTWTYSQVDTNTKEGLFLIMNETSSPTIHSNAYFTSEWCKNVVTLENSQITNEGTIIIDAVVTGGAGGSPYNSIVFGDYSKMTLDSNSKITNTGTINCYGFIDEKKTEVSDPNLVYDPDLVISDNNVNLYMESGTLNTILTIVEHRGGDVFMGMVNPTEYALNSAINVNVGSPPTTNKVYSPQMTTFAFQRFYIQSVSVNMMVSNQSTINGEVTLFANGGPNQATLSFMGKANEDETKSPIFQLNDNAYATFKYTHYEEDADTTDQEATNRKMDIDTYGDVTINPLVLRLTIEEEREIVSNVTAYAIIYLDMNTTSCPLPISHYFDITFRDDGTQSTYVDILQQDLKILPGGKISIDEGVTVDANRLIVYNDNSLLNGSSVMETDPVVPTGSTTKDIAQGTPYPDMDDPGLLEIKGTLTVVSLGGKATAASQSAILTILSHNYAISQELLITYGTSINIAVEYFITYSLPVTYSKSCYSTKANSTLTATGRVANGSDSVASKDLLASTYEGIYQNDEFVWYNTNATITLDANGGAFVSSTGSTTTVTTTVPVDMTSGCIDVSNITQVPTRTGYVFGEWYLDKEFTKALSENLSSIKYDTTLYARWKTVATIEFNSNMTGATQIAPGTVTLNYDGTPETLDAFAEKPSIYGYKFLGWYLSAADGSEKITLDTNIENHIIDDTLTVYAKWEVAETYTVEHISGKDGISFENGQTILSEEDPYDAMPKTSVADNDYGLNYYLIGWSAENDGTVDENIFFTQAPAEGETLKLYAVWGTKIKVQFNVNNADLGLSDPAAVYLKPSQTYNVLNFAVVSSLHNGDRNIDIPVYWNEGFTASGSGTISNNIITAIADGGETVVIQPVWEEKHIVKIDLPSSCSNCNWSGTVTGTLSGTYEFTKGTADDDKYFLPTETITLECTLTGYKRLLLGYITIAQHTVTGTIVEETTNKTTSSASDSDTSVSIKKEIETPTGGKTTTFTITHST